MDNSSNRRRRAFWAAAGLLLFAVAACLCLKSAAMKAFPVEINGKEYILRATEKMDPTYAEIPYYAGGEPIGTLFLRSSSKKTSRIDLSGLSGCGELMAVRIRTEGGIGELILPEADYLACYAQAASFERIRKDGTGNLELVLSFSPKEIVTSDETVINLTVEEAHDMSFLNDGKYDSVSVLGGSGKAPDASCDVRHMDLCGKWNLDPLKGNTSLEYLALSGEIGDLSLLQDTSVRQLYLGSICDLSALRNLSSLKILHVWLGPEDPCDLEPVGDLSWLETLNIITDAECPDLMGTKDMARVTEVCSMIPGMEENLPILRQCVQNGAEIGVSSLSKRDTKASVFDLLPPWPEPGQENEAN